VVMNPTRGMEKLSVNNSIVIGNELDIPPASLLADTILCRLGKAGLIVSTDALNTLTINNNYYVNSGGTNTRISDGRAAGLNINPTAVQIIVAPNALQAVAPVFKTPLSVDIETGVMTIAEPTGFQAMYHKPVTTGGFADAYTATLGITSYIIGTIYSFIINATNLGASTINIDLIGIQGIVLRSSGVNIPLVAKELMINQKYDILWDGSNFILQNPSEVIGSFVSTITTGGGTVTLSGTGQTLTYRSYRSLCHISGSLFVSAVSSPTGTARINNFPYNIYATSTPSDSPAPSVPFASLVTAPALGLFLTPTFTNSNVMSLNEQQSTSINANTAPLIGASTLLYINFQYRFR